MNRPTIAVAITAYHRPQFVSEAYRSATHDQVDPPDEVMVLRQTMDGSFVDGRRIGADDLERVGSMLAYALSLARSDVVCFLDDDDLFTPEKVATVRSHFARNPDLALLHNAFRNFGPEAPHPWFRLPPSYGAVAPKPSAIVRSRVLVNLSSVSVRRAMLARRADDLEWVEGGTDSAMVWAALAEGGGITAIPDVLTMRRIHESNAVKRGTAELDRGRRTMERLLLLADGPARAFVRSNLRQMKPATLGALLDGLECLSWPRTKRAMAALLRGMELRL